MCLQIGKEFKTKKEALEFIKNPKIAEKDIRVYKVLNETNLGVYYAFKYEKGFHYYQVGKKFSYLIRQSFYTNKWRITFHIGLHSCKSYNAAELHVTRRDKIVTMYIPKGSKYYEGIYNELISDQLVWY